MFSGETMWIIQWLSSLNLYVYLPDLGHTSNLVVWVAWDTHETWSLRAGRHISMVFVRIHRNYWPKCGFSIWLKMSQLVGRTGWGSLTPVQIAFSWPGCNINAGREKEKSWHVCWKVLEKDPLQCLVWEREETHVHMQYAHNGPTG